MNSRLKHRNQRKNEKLARSGATPAPARARRERGAARHEKRLSTPGLMTKAEREAAVSYAQEAADSYLADMGQAAVRQKEIYRDLKREVDEGLQAEADRWSAELAQDMTVLHNAAVQEAVALQAEADYRHVIEDYRTRIQDREHEAQQPSPITETQYQQLAREFLGDVIEPLPEPAKPTTIRVERDEPLLKVDISTLKTAEEAIAECLAPVREAMEECAQIMKSYKPPTTKSAATPTPPALQLPAFTKPATPTP